MICVYRTYNILNLNFLIHQTEFSKCNSRLTKKSILWLSTEISHSSTANSSVLPTTVSSRSTKLRTTNSRCSLISSCPRLSTNHLLSEQIQLIHYLLVNIYTTGDDKKITKNTFEKPNLALKLKSDVKKIGFNGTKWLMGFSSDSHATLFNT
jgi:hypothetical protein